jgi:hypothetical protein
MARPISLPSPWLELAQAVGGVGKLAEACGVTTRALERWASGDRTPGSIVRDHVRALARRHKVAEPWP